MDAVLTPHRSLSRRGFRRFMLAFAGLNALVGAYFLFAGAWPVMGFLGLDMLAVWLAFRANFRAALDVEERVRINPESLLVSKRNRRGRVHWGVSPLWVQVSRDETSLRLASAGKSIAIGAFLSAPEREEFAAALTEALKRTRQASQP